MRPGLWPIRQITTSLILVAIGCSAGGCSYRLFNSGVPGTGAADDITGSISLMRQHDNTALTESDLALARNAASDVLSRGKKDASQPWENPQTGARGSVTPLAAAYTGGDGRLCRDFLASYVHGTNEGWLQGEACQSGKGGWEIRAMKPWKRS